MQNEIIIDEASPHPPPVRKPCLGFWQIFNMSFGFFGIQFGWDLQRAKWALYMNTCMQAPTKFPCYF